MNLFGSYQSQMSEIPHTFPSGNAITSKKIVGAWSNPMKFVKFAFMKPVNDPVISVIIPVYNAEKYLQRCLDSLLKQGVDNMEIIAVNDASKDRSIDVLNSYAASDSRVRVIDKKQNEGSYMARDTGFKVARGKYFFFSDADDFLPDGALTTLLEHAEASGADITVGDYALFRESDGHILPMVRSRRLTSDPDDYMRGILTGVTNSLCGSLYRRELFDHHEFPRMQGQCFSDDRIVLMHLLLQEGVKVEPVEKIVYYYFINNRSMTRSRHSVERIKALIDGLFICYDFLSKQTDRFDFENDKFFAKNLSFYIETGYPVEVVEHYNEVSERLLRFSSMRRLFGLRYALHSWLSRKSSLYQKATDGCRQILWRIKGKR